MDIQKAPGYTRLFDRFLYSPAFFFFCAGMTLFANTCGAELFTYTCFVLVALYLLLCDRDLLPVMPMAICCYIAPSKNNNPGVNDQSIFAPDQGGFYMIFLVAIMLIALAYRLIRDPELGKTAFLNCKRTLLPGMIVLCLAYFLSGVNTGHIAKVGPQNLLFAFIQSAAILVPYILLTGFVRWDKAPINYLAWTGMCVGYVLLGELLFLYLQHNVIQDGLIKREFIITGWGHYNNIGGLLAMMIPFPFFLTGNSKRTGIFYLSALLFLCGLIFTCSRGAIIFGVVTYLVSYILSLIHSHRARMNIGMHMFTIAVFLAVFFLFADKLVALFQILLGYKLDPSGRGDIYIAGWQQFLNYPIFGGTFFPVDYDLTSFATSQTFLSFFPPRWHNTVIQLLASCGIVGMAAYLFHRIQTVRLFLCRFSWNKMFAFVSMLTLLATSMLDCHFFNVGPVLFYSLMLAFVEKRLD